MTKERFSRRKFIKLGATLGAGAAGSSILAACGGNGGGGNGDVGKEEGGAEETGDVGGATEAEGTQGVAQVEGGEAIAQESAVPQGSAVEFTDEETGQPAVLVHLDRGDFVAYSAVCTHRQCTVGYIDYGDGQLLCPCHGSVFDPSNDGAVVNGPANQPLPEIPVEVQNGQVVRV